MTRYTATLFLCLLVPVVGTTITDPSQWPGLDDLPKCVQNIFGGCLNDCSNGGGCISCYVGCADWTCACDQFSAAISAASSVAATACSTSQPDIASATSIVNGFCGQLLATPTGPTTPASVPTASSTSTGDTSGRHAPTSMPIGMNWFPPYSTTRLNQPNRSIVISGWWFELSNCYSFDSSRSAIRSCGNIVYILYMLYMQTLGDIERGIHPRNSLAVISDDFWRFRDHHPRLVPGSSGSLK